MTAAELNHFSLELLHKLPPFTLVTRELNEIWSFIERKKKEKEHCGAIMRADCEVRVGTASEGMSRLARLVLLQRKGCMFERIHLRIEISCQRVIPLSVHGEADESLGQCFCPKWFSPPTIPDSQSLTLEGNRGVRQIKQSYPVASVIACVL